MMKAATFIKFPIQNNSMNNYISSFLFFILLISCTVSAQTPRITFKAPFAYPEGTAYNSANNMFYVSSVKTGTIGSVDLQGNYKVFYEDAGLKSSFGMKADMKRNCLWVCVGDPNYSIYADSSTYKKMIRLISIDLKTGKKIQDIDLSHLYQGKHFANDLTLDDAGNIYITDSYSPVIYKVNTFFQPTVFAVNDLFKANDIGLNGITWSKQGYLITVNNSNGSILKVDINNSQNVTQVKIKNLFPGADGILFDDQNNLLLSQNKGVDKIFKISSTDDWQSAKVTAATSGTDRFQNPSTSTMKGNDLYIMNSKLNEIKDSSLTPSKEFSLQLALFKPVN